LRGGHSRCYQERGCCRSCGRLASDSGNASFYLAAAVAYRGAREKVKNCGGEATEAMTTSKQITRVRCAWAKNELSIPYHDEEWGVPVHDEHKWFEFLILEGAQAGLSWDTILKKRARYCQVFDGFDPSKVARYDKKKVRELLRDAGIIRNRLKIDAAITNARAF